MLVLLRYNRDYLRGLGSVLRWWWMGRREGGCVYVATYVAGRLLPWGRSH